MQFGPINGNTAMLSINKYANDAIFVYADEAISNGIGPGKDLPGKEADSSIKDCKSDDYKGCWAHPDENHILSSGELGQIAIGVYPEGDQKLDKDAPDDFDLTIPAYTDQVDGFALFKCAGESEGQDGKPPMRMMKKRNLELSRA